MNHLAAPWLLLECGLSHDRPKSGIWISKAGIRLTAIGKHGAPFGRARAVWMYLATKANQSGSTVEVSLSEMAEWFGGKGRTNKEHLRRLAECYVHRIDRARPGDPAQTRRRRLLEIIDTRGSVLTVSLYSDFLESARDAVQCPTEHVAEFLTGNKLAPLDLYLWYQWRAHRGDKSPVDAFGPDGPYALLPIADNIDKRRDEFRKRHDQVVDVWPECPFDHDGDQIVHCSDPADRAGAADASPRMPTSRVADLEATGRARSVRKPTKPAQKPARKTAKPARKAAARATRPITTRNKPAPENTEQGKQRPKYSSRTEARRELKERMARAGITEGPDGRVYFPPHLRKKVRRSQTSRSRSPDPRKRSQTARPASSPTPMQSRTINATAGRSAPAEQTPPESQSHPESRSTANASQLGATEEISRALDQLRATLREISDKH